MDWDRLKTFYVVASSGSLSGAEQTLRVTQSALSRQINQLEHEMKSRLFERHARGLRLTEAGQTLFPIAEKIYMQILGVQSELMDQKDEASGKLTIVMPPTYGTFWFISHLAEFSRLFPEIKVSIISSEASNFLHTVREDVYVQILSFEPPESSDTCSHLMCSYRQYVFAGKVYLQERGVPQTIADIDRHQIIACRNSLFDSDEIDQLVNPLLYVGRAPRMSRTAEFIVGDVASVFAAVENNLGLAMLPWYVARQSTSVDAVFLKDAAIEALSMFHKFLVYPKHLAKFKRIEVFKSFILEKSQEIIDLEV